jgi:hypothetical protein
MPPFREGIYLQETKGNIGTGNTSSKIVYKNYYAVRPSGSMLELFLLDDDFIPMGLRETSGLSEFENKFVFQPDMQDKYLAILPKIGDPVPAPPKPVKPKPAKTKPAVQAFKPAEAFDKPASSPPAKPKAEEKSESGNWWEATSKGSDSLFKK